MICDNRPYMPTLCVIDSESFYLIFDEIIYFKKIQVNLRLANGRAIAIEFERQLTDVFYTANYISKVIIYLPFTLFKENAKIARYSRRDFTVKLHTK